MSQAAYIKKIQVETSSGVFTEIPFTSGSLDLGGDILDDTNALTTAGWHSRLIGLTDWSITLDTIWTAADVALAFIRAALLARTDVVIQYLPAGVVGTGFQGSVKVESFNHSGDVNDQETVSIVLQANGALAAAS